MKQEKIINKQNELFFLNCQYSAKYYFNKAEKINYLIWFLCILNLITVFFQINSIYCQVFLFTIDVIVAILQCYFNYCVENGAKLRNFFDALVLDIKPNRYTEEELRNIKNLVDNVISHSSTDYHIQVTHTGRDNPPGVLNWYEFSHQFSNDEAIYECQRQNCWFNEKLSKARIIISSILFLLIITLGFVSVFKFNLLDNLIYTLLCTSGFFIKTLERIFEHYKYHEISLKIKGACNLVENDKTKSNIESLQELIEQRRKTHVLEMNIVHKKIASKLSKKYEKIS